MLTTSVLKITQMSVETSASRKTVDDAISHCQISGSANETLSGHIADEMVDRLKLNTSVDSTWTTVGFNYEKLTIKAYLLSGQELIITCKVDD